MSIVAKSDVADPSALSLDSVKAWLRMQACDTGQDAILKTLIAGGKARAAKITGYHFDGSETVEYIRDWPKSIQIDEGVDYTLEVHSGGAWKHQVHELIGDTICLPCDSACSCDCSGCDGAPRLRITCRQAPCSEHLEGDIVTYVLKYVAYNFENRGDADTNALSDIDRILSPYMKVAFA